MDTIEKIKESGIAPAEIWYLSTLVPTSILILFIAILTFFVKGFFVELKDTLKDLKENIIWLTKMVNAHEIEHRNHKEDIDELKRRRQR